jgi:hypothetical protein
MPSSLPMYISQTVTSTSIRGGPCTEGKDSWDGAAYGCGQWGQGPTMIRLATEEQAWMARSIALSLLSSKKVKEIKGDIDFVW